VWRTDRKGRKSEISEKRVDPRKNNRGYLSSASAQDAWGKKIGKQVAGGEKPSQMQGISAERFSANAKKRLGRSIRGFSAEFQDFCPLGILRKGRSHSERLMRKDRKGAGVKAIGGTAESLGGKDQSSKCRIPQRLRKIVTKSREHQKENSNLELSVYIDEP